MGRVLTASYVSREEAEDAAERLVAAGLTRQEISILGPEENGGAYTFAIEPRRSIMAGLGGGALFGLLLGAAAGAVFALVPESIALLGDLGPDLAEAGPVVAGLAGAGAGAAALGLLGALIGLTRTRHAAVMRDGEQIGAAGFVLVGVAVPRDMQRSARHVLANAGAHKIKRG